MAAAAPWKSLLLRALESNSHIKHSSYFQLATVGSDGKPYNRTVVFRGFAENSDKIQINTDSRTRKICWYFTDTWEQFRINGTVDVIDASTSDPAKSQLREKSWFASSIKSRLQYLGPNPGLPCLTEEPAIELQVDPASGPVATFCLLVLDPQQVDYLNLKRSQRTMFTFGQNANGENCWTSVKINP